MLARGACRALRRDGGALGLDPYAGFALRGGWRIVLGVLPPLVALLVAADVGAAEASGRLAAFAALVGLTAVVGTALAWLQEHNRRASVEELAHACDDLAAGSERALGTGSVDASIVDLARRFNAAADRVRTDRRVSSERYRALFEGAADAIVLADPESGRIVLANARAAELVGRTPAALRALPYAALFAADTRARHPAIDRPALLAGETAVVDGEVVRADGSTCPVDIALSAVPAASGWLVQAILHDVSERKRIEEALAAQNATLRAAQERLLAHDRAKSEFLGTVSHELRTPLNVMIGYTEMLLDGSVGADAADDVLRLAGGRTLASLVEDTLAVLRLDAATVRLDVEPVAIADLFEELQDADRFLRRPAAVTERWIAEPGLPVLVSDRRKLRQILTNLVGNARKFTERGTIEVRATAGADGRSIRVTVRDTGCGIPAEELPNVFDAYRQVASRRAADGCGLGLYIVRRYVELLGGRVSCESRVGVGTTFTVDLPCDRPGAADGPQPRRPGSETRLSPG